MHDHKDIDLDPENFTSDQQRELLTYWLKIKEGRQMPCRDDMDPVDIPRLLSGIWLADVVEDDGLYFKVRLFGTDLVRAFQLESTHMQLDEVTFTGDIIERLKILVQTKKAYYSICDFPIESVDYNYYSTLTLPMSSDGENVDVILSYVHCYE